MGTDDNDALTKLIDLCEDAREFYSSASHQTTSPRLRKAFRKMASVRESIVINLKSHFASEFGDVQEGGTITGQASNIFKLLKAKLGDTERTLILELERAEDDTLEEFRDVQLKDLSESTRQVIERQMRLLIETHDHMKSLKQELQDID